MKLCLKIIVYGLLLLVTWLDSYSQSREYSLKASYLEKIARYSEWPYGTKVDTFTIKVIGRSPFEGALEYFYNTRPINGKPVSIKYISSIDQADNCHILFISGSEKKRLTSIIEFVGNKPILTICETKGFIEKGVIVKFYKTEENTVHFEISRENLKNSGIKMDFLLLSFAKLVK